MFHLVRGILLIWIHKCIMLHALIVTNSKIIREDYVKIEATEKDLHQRYRREAEVFPKKLQINISAIASRIQLDLTRNNLDLDIPVYTHLGEDIVRQNAQFKHPMVFYTDVRHTASFGLQCDDRIDDSSCEYALSGHLSINGRHHIISPRSTDDGVHHQHVLIEVEDDYSFGTDYLEPPGPKFHSSERSRPLFSGSLETNTHYKVELFAVCDYAIYTYWFSRQSSGYSEAEKSQGAINDMKEHYAHIINAMNVIYGSINGVAWDIEIIFVGIYVATNPSLSSWTEDIKHTRAGDREWVDGEAALNNFTSWLTTQNGLPEYDHAMAFTGYELHSDNYESGLLGMAWVGRLCYTDVSNLLASSIQEDHLQAMLGHVAAHELGHNLGARHDGQNNLNSCSESDKYVMAPSLSATTSDEAVNRYHFSSCSVEYFQAFINTLDENSMNCMTSLTASDSTINLAQYNNIYNGKVYDLDEQCKQNFNESSYLCRSFHYADPTTVCRYIYCAIPDNPGYCRVKIPWDGTTCGDGKWCVAGQCVNDARAKSVNPSCVLGDAPFCSTEVTRSGLCYQEYYQVWHCCDLCESYQTGILGCEYGDRSSGCDPNSCETYTDYSRDTLCCKTCRVEVSTETSDTLSNTASIAQTETPETTYIGVTTTATRSTWSSAVDVSAQVVTTGFSQTSTKTYLNAKQDESEGNDSNNTAIIAAVVTVVSVIGIAAIGVFIYIMKSKTAISVAPL